jgi:hypothetical protein
VNPGPVAVATAAKSSSWNTHDTRLLVVAVLGIALIVVLIAESIVESRQLRSPADAL